MGFRQERRILRKGFNRLQKKGSSLSESERSQFEADLRKLDRAILDKQKEEAASLSSRISSFLKTRFPKTAGEYTKELVGSICFALIVAFAIRQFWFELYEVPTGSMRPTIEELDRMVVSKTTFGLHIPFTKKLWLFSDDRIKRTGIIVFTVADMDVPDADMLYFHVFPGKKRYVKRCIAKPGDTIYFYGGQVYGIDREGNPITEWHDEEFLKKEKIEKIDHVPYITFEGKSLVGRSSAPHLYDSVTFKQMNLPVAKLRLLSPGKIEGRFFNGEEWLLDKPEALKSSHSTPMSYSDLWGIGNYAMARLLTKEEAVHFYHDLPTYSNEEAPLLYLELHHTPNLTYPKPEIRKDEQGRYHPSITPFTTLIPLSQTHLENLQHALYTARFIVSKGQAYRYQEGGGRSQHPEFDVPLPGIPNGTYEFYYGKGYQIHFGGIQTSLKPSHPLYRFNPEQIRTLFNLGIGFNIVFAPFTPYQPYNPQRFAYFKEGDLYLMGAPILKKDDPTLQKFVEKEIEKQNRSSAQAPYIAFIDHGSPLKNGELDTDFIRNFGLKVPDNGLVALGDNYAMSADSREFGFVPKENLRGAPSFTFWPPGKRLGRLPQPAYPWFTLPNIIIWTLIVIIVLGTWLIVRARNRHSLFSDEEKKKIDSH